MVRAYPYFGNDHTPGDRVYVELPLQRCRLGSVSKSIDDLGFPALSVTIDRRDSLQFEEFTAKHIGHAMVMILNGKIVSEATLNSRLPGMFQLYGRFTDAQVQELADEFQ
jgi:preprotein translocase subunit SecD